MARDRCSVAFVLALSVASCAQGTSPNDDPIDARAIDARVAIDGPPGEIDAPEAIDAAVDAAIDAPPIDAAIVDAAPIDGTTTDARVDAAIDGGTTTSVVFANTQVALYRIDTTTYAATRVADFGWPASVGNDAMADIAIAPDGSIIGASGTRLYRCSATTAACTLIGSLTQTVNALGYVPAGVLHPGVETLVGAKSDGTFYEIDANSAAMNVLGHFSSGHASSGDLAYAGGALVAAVNPGGANDSLARINATTGATTVVGTTGRPWVWGLATNGSTLLGFTLGREVVTINTSTGATTVVATGSVDWYGAAGR
jgi:hypothetical protein